MRYTAEDARREAEGDLDQRIRAAVKQADVYFEWGDQ